MKKLSVLSVLFAGILLAGCGSAEKENPVLSIEGGKVQGVVAEHSVVYKGIPYAAPPVGDLRWRAPQPVVGWDTIMLCDHFLNAAPQPAHDPNDGSYGTEFFPEDAPFSEDCLQLNIWVPKGASGHPEKQLPVALWIHGGAYMCGWSFEREMDGEAWAARDVILVTANYRLGLFGFFSHPLLTAESGRSGNYGLMDQIAALKWVKRNIAQFGGDPEHVMIFGQSAGGGSIRCMISSPESKGLISSACVMSAGGLGSRMRENISQSEADALGKEITDLAGISTLEEMRAASYEQLQVGLDRYNELHHTWQSFPPHLDDILLPEPFDQAAMSSHIADVPMLFGSVANDMPGLDQGIGDFAALRDSLGAPATYVYRFEVPAPSDGRPCLQGAFHSSELWYVFHTQDRSWRPYTEADKALSDRMVDYWTNFAKYGTPNAPSEADWQPYTRENPYVQILK